MIFGSLLAVLAIVGLASAKVEVKTGWHEDRGWEVRCNWNLRDNDSLQSVKLYRNDQQYAVFRPEITGRPMHEEFHSPAFIMRVACSLSSGCLTSMLLLQEATEDVYSCEVSGERPTFYEEKSQQDAFVVPSVADISMSVDPKTKLDSFNCSSSGIPAPKLVWTVDGKKLPVDMTTSKWNSKTKLWDSWSVYTGPGTEVNCVPEASTKNRQTITGLAVTVSGADQMAISATTLCISGLLLLPLL